MEPWSRSKTVSYTHLDVYKRQGGYRVSEINPLTGRAVVRDRNAHAWVEAWTEGAWHGFDPTPATESFAKKSSTLDNLGDLVSVAWERVALAIARLGPLGTVGVLLGVIALLFGVRSASRGLRRRLERNKAASSNALPLPCFEALTEALASTGHERDPSEPLEAFARRLAALGSPWATDASRVILLYAELRYGNIGDERSVSRDVDAVTRAIRAAAR